MNEKNAMIEKKSTAISKKDFEIQKKVDALNDLSYELRNRDPNKALTNGNKAYRLASKISYNKGLGYSLRNIGISEWRIAKYSSSIDNFSKSIIIFDKIGDKVGKASSLNGMGIVYKKLRDYARAIIAYNESLDLFKELNDKHGEALSLSNIGVIYASLGDYSKAINLYNKSIILYKEIGNKYGEAISLNNIGFAQMNKGDDAQALSSFIKAQKMFSQINDLQGEAETLANIGVVYNNLNEYERALKYELRGLQVKEKINDKRGQSNFLINIGNTYNSLGDLDQSLEYLTRSLKIKREIGDKQGEGNSLASIALLYIKKNNFSKATGYLNESLKIQREIGDKHGEIVSLTSWSNIYMNKKDYDKAIDYLENALELAKYIKSKDSLCEINKNLSDCYKHKGNYKKALEYHNNFHEIKKEIFNEQSDTKLINLKVIHQVDTAQKEAEIERLRNIELEHSLSELTSALDVTDIISRTGIDGTITYVNENFCNISGYSSEELIGKNHRITKSNFHTKEFYKDLWETIIKGKVWKGEIKNKSKKGKMYWIYITIVPLLDSKNKITEFLAISTNITLRKKAEGKLKRQYAELEKTNTELDKFVYSASHDLRAPLTSILGVISLTKMDTQEMQTRDNLEMMEKSINRLDRFVKDIINYSHNTRLKVQREKIDFYFVISETIDNLKYIEGFDRIDIKINVNEKVPFYSDKTRLKVIFNNLISNAIRYHKRELAHPYIKVNVDVSSKKVVIQIIDNGDGIDKKYHVKIFKMFSKLSTRSLGSGLGLYIAKETVNKLKGTISVKSEIDKGCTFIIELPNKHND